MQFSMLTYQDILDINLWCQIVTSDTVNPTYGIKDDNLLKSIPQSIVQNFGGKDLYPTVHDKCSYLWYSLSQYHCFVDGNKRTALVTTIALLALNGYNFEINYDDLYDICIALASSKLNGDEIKSYLINHTNKISEKTDKQLDSVEKILNYLSTDVEFIVVLERLAH